MPDADSGQKETVTQPVQKQDSASQRSVSQKPVSQKPATGNWLSRLARRFGPTSRRAAGLLILLMLVLSIGHALAPGSIPLWLAGVTAWVAALLLVPMVSGGQLIQIGVLIVAGAAVLFAAAWAGGEPEWPRLLTANTSLLTMIAAIGFLRIISVSGDLSAEDLPLGRGAYRRTLFGVAVFGTFINMSAPLLITDRLAQTRKIDRFTAQSITRVFSGCSAWSPFFGGMAVVLTYLPDMNLLFVMLVNLPFALAGLVLVNLESAVRYRQQMAEFRGYSLTLSNLWIPFALAVAVVAGASTWPDLSILVVIAVAALFISVAALLVQYGPAGAYRRLRSHVLFGLPAMAGEILLFTCAGVLVVALAALVDAGMVPMPLTEFGYGNACLVLALIILVSMLGVHPVITISGMTPLLLPLDPNAELLGVTYLLGWSLGTCASPLSGTHVVFQGRYGVPALRAAFWNWPFAAAMYLVGCVVLYMAYTLH